MPIRITGMNSGLDTDNIIKEMVKAQRYKVDTLKKEQTSLQWKQDAWKDLNTKVLSLFNKTLNNMRFENAYSKMKTTVTHPGLVNVISGENAVNGTQELKIVSQAKAGYLTGSQLAGSTKYTENSKLKDIDPANFGAGESGTFNVTVGDKTTAVTVTGDTTLAEVVAKLKESGVNANFDEKNQRMFISAKESGADKDFSITSSNAAGGKVLQALGVNVSLDSDEATLEKYREYAAYYVSGNRGQTLANMSAMITKDVDARAQVYKTSNESIAKSMTDIQTKMQAIKDKDSYDPADTETDLNDKITALNGAISALPEGQEKEEKKAELAKANQKLADVKQLKTYQDEVGKLQTTKASNDSYITTAADGKVTATAKLQGEVEQVYYDRAEYASQVIGSYVPGSGSGGANKINGKDATIELNGERFTSNTNVFEVNGLTLTILGESTEKITVTTQSDTDGIYNLVKGFLKEYNGIINEMDKLYNADLAKGYKPLTDEEKEAMSEKEVEKWEQKIKDSSLRRDDTLGSVSSQLKNMMMSGMEVNGKTMHLSDFGINSQEYLLAAPNEKNAYYIDGDTDNTVSAGKPDQLKSAIANDPSSVMSFFTQLSTNLYDSVDRLMGKGVDNRDISSYNTLYNDKLMKKQHDEYTKKIAAQEKKVTALEDKWYAKFSAMETAMAKMQSSQNAVSSMLGG